MRVLVVDDEAPAREKIRRLLREYPDFSIVGEASGGAEAVKAIEALEPDVVLLDVQMPEVDGFDVLSMLSTTRLPHIVFVTAHHEHAVRAFEVRAFDYLLKPVSPTRFGQLIQRLRGAGSARSADIEQLRALLRDVRGSFYVRHLLLHGDNKSHFVAADRIDWIEADGNRMRIHVGNQMFTGRIPMKVLMGRLDPAKFLRISKSHIVRIDAVRELHPWSHGDYQLVLHSGARLMWTRRYRATAPNAFAL